MKVAKVLKDGAIPLYYQLEMSLRSRLSRGEFAPNDSFPSEVAIGRDYGVSRMTVRQALTALEQDSLISRKRGRGTHVTDKVRHLWVPKLTGSLDEAIVFGLAEKYQVDLLSREEINPSQQVISALCLQSTKEKVHRIRRIRLYEGEPLAYIVNHLPADIGCMISSEDILSRLILVNLETRAGLNLTEADQRIGATTAEPEIASLLQIRTGDPLVHMERTVFDSRGRAVNFTSVLFRADRYWYKVKLKRTGRIDKIDWSLT